jgi:hypothetical protein
MNTNLPSWLLPAGIAAILLAIIGCFAGPLLGLSQSAGTGWGFAVGAVLGVAGGLATSRSKP